MIGPYCGTETPPDILSVGNELYMQFSSDNSFSYNGFKAVYSRGRYHNTYQFFVPMCYIQSQKLYNLVRTQIILYRMQNEHLLLYHLHFIQITICKVVIPFNNRFEQIKNIVQDLLCRVRNKNLIFRRQYHTLTKIYVYLYGYISEKKSHFVGNRTHKYIHFNSSFNS